jgi:hypothetical protein
MPSHAQGSHGWANRPESRGHAGATHAVFGLAWVAAAAVLSSQLVATRQRPSTTLIHGRYLDISLGSCD